MSKTVLITGNSSGLGESLVHAYARAGWNVTATMRTNATAPAEYAGLPNVLVERLDVTDDDSIRSAIAAGEDRFGPIDVLVNVAAFVQEGTLEEHSIDQLRREFDTNAPWGLSRPPATVAWLRPAGSPRGQQRRNKPLQSKPFTGRSPSAALCHAGPEDRRSVGRQSPTVRCGPAARRLGRTGSARGTRPGAGEKGSDRLTSSSVNVHPLPDVQR